MTTAEAPLPTRRMEPISILFQVGRLPISTGIRFTPSLANTLGGLRTDGFEITPVIACSIPTMQRADRQNQSRVLNLSSQSRA